MLLRSIPRLSWSAVALLLALPAVGVASSAEAQGWLADRDRAEGPGIRLGDFELHPGIGVELGYDSNLYYTSDDPAPTLPGRYDSGILRVSPHIYISTLGAERRTQGETGDQAELPVITFRAGVAAAYYEYFADERRRNVSLDAGLRLNILPGRVFSISIYDDFSRGIRPFTENTFETSTARDHNNAGVDFTFQTDGGVFAVRAGYRFGLDYFEGRAFQYANSMTHTVATQETFRFLPQTAIVHDLEVAYRDYFEGSLVGPTAVFDSTRLTTRIGLNGAITPEISFLAMIGYGAGFFDSTIDGYDQDYESVVAHAQLGWRIAENAQLRVGYERTLQPSFVGNYSSRDRGYVGAQMMFGGSFMLGLDAGVAYVDFGQMVDQMGDPLGTDAAGAPTTNREDIRVDASLFAEYRFTEWLALNGTVGYVGDFTDFRYRVDTGMGAFALDPAGYNKVELWLGVRVFY